MQGFFGGNPVLVIIRLCVISVIVGVLLSALGLSPFDIIESFKKLVIRIYDLGFEAIDWMIGYFLLGAVIVFPIWLITRFFKLTGRGSDAQLERKSRQSEI